MDVILALILACGVHRDDHLVEALAMKLSLGNQYFVGDLATLDTYDASHTVAEAHRWVEAIAAKGGRPSVGYMAVPVTWAARFGRSVDDLFDGCTNIGIATAMLSDYEHACSLRPGHQQRSGHHRPLRSPSHRSSAMRLCILRRLEGDLAITGIVDHVLPDVAKLDAKAAHRHDDPPAARAPVFSDDSQTAGFHESGEWSGAGRFAPSAPAPTRDSPSVPTNLAPRRLAGGAPLGSR